MRSKQAGFTLVEVVISLAVLAIAFFGMISVIAYTSRVNAQVRERMIATRAAEKKIEQMLNVGDFNQLDLFRAQTEGRGWEQVLTTDVDKTTTGYTRQALFPIAPSRMPPCKLPTGYDYNFPIAPDPKAVLFVRFPLNAAGTAYSEALSGQFADSFTLANPLVLTSARTYINIDMDTTPAVSSGLGIASINVLPCIVEVLWSGVSGQVNVLRYRYTFYRKT